MLSQKTHYGKTTKSSTTSCNVSYKKQIDSKTLIGILSGETPYDGWLFHLDTFFNELPKCCIEGVMAENSLSLGQLAAVFRQLPKPLQGKNFKEMLACHG